MGVAGMDELSFSDSELDLRVRNALNAVIQGDCDSYNELVAVIYNKERLDAEQVALLVTCLKAVAGAASCVEFSHHCSLLAAISRMSLWDYGTDVMDALVELLVSLASSNADYVDFSLGALVYNFMPPETSYFMDLLKQPRGLFKKTQVLDRVHSTLKNISNLVPLSPLRLEKIVMDGIPHIYKKEPFIVTYVENMLRLESGDMGELVRSMVLVTLMDRLVDLDVEIAWEEILHDDFHKGIFDMELEDLEGPAYNIEQDSNELSRVPLMQRFSSAKLFAEKLDSLMVLTFEHLNSCSESGRLVPVFEILLQSFQKTILTAYKSKFAQFVMFFACSLDPETCGKMFANVLLNIFVTGVSPEWRMSAVAYLASYLARAKFIPISFVASMLESVVNSCFEYCKNYGDINPKAHKIFYAGCQATMYVLCFRMKQMLAVPGLKSQLQLMHIDDILGHPLKPMQVCLPSIVEEFLRLVKANHIFLTLVEHDLPESQQHSRVFGGVDMFFPFDPCLLSKCDRYIRPNYVYWSMVRSRYEEAGTSDEDEDEDEDVGVGGDAMSDGSDADEFDCSLHKMSIVSHKFGGRMQMPSKIRPSTSPESL